jgi:hypothetical protein
MIDPVSFRMERWRQLHSRCVSEILVDPITFLFIVIHRTATTGRSPTERDRGKPVGSCGTGLVRHIPSTFENEVSGMGHFSIADVSNFQCPIRGVTWKGLRTRSRELPRRRVRPKLPLRELSFRRRERREHEWESRATERVESQLRDRLPCAGLSESEGALS